MSIETKVLNIINERLDLNSNPFIVSSVGTSIIMFEFDDIDKIIISNRIDEVFQIFTLVSDLNECSYISDIVEMVEKELKLKD